METNLLLAILFLKGKNGIKQKEIAKILEIKTIEAKKIIRSLKTELIKKDLPFIIKDFEDYIWLSLSSEISLILAKNMKRDISVRLSKSLIETLTIIAYNQPVSKQKIEKIRGVSADYALIKLLNYNLIQDVKELDLKGPKKFYTTQHFLTLFNFRSLEDLPKIEKDFEEITEEIEIFNYD